MTMTLIGSLAVVASAGQQSPWDNVLVPQLITETSTLWFDSPELPNAGVPCMSRGPAGEIVQMFQWFPNGDGELDFIARRVSYDEGRTWSGVQAVQWTGGPKVHSRQADPSLVLLGDGSWRLYFTCHVEKDVYPATWSAISDDGLNFTWEDGKRMELADAGLLDPSVTYFDKFYHFYSPRPGKGDGAIYATSPNGLDFTRQPDVVVKGSTDTKFLGNPMVSYGSMYFFGTLEPKTSWAGVFCAKSSNGVDWTVLWTTSGTFADPAAIETPSGTLVFITSLQGPG